jgi:hydrogenase 3 maturation protease
MPDLKAKLQTALRGAERVAVLAVGSRLRGDDAVGLLAGDELEKLLAEKWGQAPNRREACRFGASPHCSAGAAQIAVFHGETAPENLTGEIRKFQPTHLVLVDAADMGLAPGSAELIDLDAAGEDASFSTHRLPVVVLLDYLHDATGCRSVIVGIQPGSRAFSLTASQEMEQAAKHVAQAIAEACGR